MRLVSVFLSALVSFLSLNSFAYEAGDFILRAGVAAVDPQDDASPDIVGVGGDVALGLTGTYMLTKNVGLEILASSPFTHDIDLKGGDTVATVKHLPPTISVQYFFDTGTALTPYAGIGVNYFMVQESKMTSYGETTLGTSKIDVGDSVGVAFSAGLDYQLLDNLVLNVAVWNIDVDTTADIGDGATKIDVSIDPWVYMIGVGYKF